MYSGSDVWGCEQWDVTGKYSGLWIEVWETGPVWETSCKLSFPRTNSGTTTRPTILIRKSQTIVVNL